MAGPRPLPSAPLSQLCPPQNGQPPGGLRRCWGHSPLPVPSPEEPRFRSGHRDMERPCLVLWLWPWEQPAEGQSWLRGRSQRSEEPRLSSRRGCRSRSCPCTCWVCHTQWPTAAHSRTPGVEQTAHTMDTKRSRCSGPPAFQNTGLCSQRQTMAPRARLPGALGGGNTGGALGQGWLLTGSPHLPQSWALPMLWLQSRGDRRNATHPPAPRPTCKGEAGNPGGWGRP